MYWIRVIVGGALAALGGFLVLCNVYLCVRALRGSPSPSLMPVLPGLIAAVGIVALPFGHSWLAAPLPILLDSVSLLVAGSAGRGNGTRDHPGRPPG